jgi:DNA-binding transcriptional regulator YiaG
MIVAQGKASQRATPWVTPTKKFFPLSPVFLRGRVALLGIAQRTITVSGSHISSKRHRRKIFPTVLKTLGDRIHVKRVEKGLLQGQLGRKLGVAREVVMDWERDLRTPNDDEWQSLAKVLGLEPGLLSIKSNT